MEQYLPLNLSYCRFETLEIRIGNIPCGGNNPVRIQSMTDTNTNDIEASVNQCIRIFDAGADYVRLTTQGIKEVESLSVIKNELYKKGYKKPLIADVHFNPKVAEYAAGIVEKVRINPGNFHKSEKKDNELSEADYLKEIEIIKEKIEKLVEICKANKTAIRIGVNHGSLSDRILTKYGNTPEGMVVSAMEFLRIFKQLDFSNVVVSMKASNPKIMIYAYRLLHKNMIAENMNFPLHLGVTEAGEGEDGRIKSCIGIGALLLDGLGDTIRVSLTEDPANEIIVAKKLLKHIENTYTNEIVRGSSKMFFNPFRYSRRKTKPVLNIGGNNPPVVVCKLINSEDVSVFDKADYVFAENFKNSTFGNSALIINNSDFSEKHTKQKFYPYYNSINEFFKSNSKSEILNFILINNSEFDENNIKKLNSYPVVFILSADNTNGYYNVRAFINDLIRINSAIPIIVRKKYEEREIEDLQVKSSCDLGPLFIDGLADGIFIENDQCINNNDVISISFSILQASNSRISKTEFISCPGCGRTLFNLQQKVKEVKAALQHMPGLKIAVMGCIVNGPGEMADADYGYVGAGPGRVNIYKDCILVKKNIPESEALNELIKLINEKNSDK
jgi:(E)-4-hydroxy-3-methylbut-2-enyl-diphosphate synthase